MGGCSAQDTIYLCNFKVSVDGDWLCLREVDQMQEKPVESSYSELKTPSPIDTHFLIPRDPVIVERRNLLNISKLIVKELIETSMKYGRMLDSDHMTLQHFFIVLEHVLRHGLRSKKGLLGPKKELWDILQTVEKLDTEAQDITSSIRELPNVRTHMGRARAWLRVALMQKKLADYIKLLVDNRDTVLTEYFEPDALMMSEEAVVIVGLLGGLNVIDCNLCIKEEDLDHERGVIDFSLYLRSNYHNNNSPETPESDLEYDNMSTVLDQKNYIEELNRHLNSTVANLQSRVEQLTTTNALMKEDLEISRTNMVALMQENTVLKAQRNQNKNMKFKHRETVCISEEKRKSAVFDDEGTKDMDLLKHQLMNERKLREEAEGELIDQTCHSSQLESTVSMLEKDIHEKQEIIISLRKQLEDIKTINLEMYRKLQECEEELTQKAEVVTRLQAKTLQIGQMLNNLQKFNHILTDDNIQRKTTIPRYGKALVPVKETTKMSKMDLNSHFNDKEKQQEKPYDVSPAFAVVKTEDESSTEIKQHEQLVDELVTNEDSSEINIEEKQENRQQEKSCVTNESDTLLDEE